MPTSLASTQGSGRIESLDGLRGFSSLMVLLLHVAMMLQTLAPERTQLWDFVPGSPAVLVFFVLSGVVLVQAPLKRIRTEQSYDWLSYYPRRLVRLYLPLIAAITLGIVAGGCAALLRSTARSATAIAWGGAIFPGSARYFDAVRPAVQCI